MSMRILVFEPGITYPKIRHIDGTLESMQEIVGGYIEPVYVPECGLDAVLLVNEEGRLKGLAANRRVGDRLLVGIFMLCKIVEEGLVGLDEEEAKQLRDVCSRWQLAAHA